MNRIQFYTLNALGVLFVGLVAIHFVSAHRLNYAQSQMIQAQQKIAQASTATSELKQLAIRVVEVQQKTNDQALKDLMARQHIVTHAPPPNAGLTPAPEADGQQPSALTPPTLPDAPNSLNPPLTR